MMKKECNRFPELNHKSCALDPYEKIVVEYLESRGFGMEKLCTEWLPEGERTPDFRVTGDKNLCYLCEVKALTSSTGALTKSDWKYANRLEYEQLKKLAESQNVPIVVTRDQMRLWKGEISYPTGGRATADTEREYEKKLKDYLNDSSVADKGLEIVLHRGDWFVWTEEEIIEFGDYLIEKLELISKGQVPRGWNKDFWMINGYYRKEREDIWYLSNQIVVTKSGSPLSVRVESYLGVNWKAVEGECRKAQSQIRDRLMREDTPDKIARLVFIFLEGDLIFSYFPDVEKLSKEVKRRIFSKFPKLSAVAFCRVSKIDVETETHMDYSETIAHFFPEISEWGRKRFLVFHTSNDNIPRLPNEVFEDGFSTQIKLSA